MAARSKFALDFGSVQNRSKVAIAEPVGFSSSYVPRNIQEEPKTGKALDEKANLKLKKAWDVALGPAKTIPMNAIMLWMSGNSVQIFSIIITGMMFFQPFTAIFQMNTLFEQYEITPTSKRLQSPLWLPKLVFFLLQILTICLGIYKCSAMGLLPTASSDWLAFLEPKQILEMSSGAIVS